MAHQDEMTTANNKLADTGLDSLSQKDDGEIGEAGEDNDAEFLTYARDAISTGTTHVNTGYTRRWKDAYRAFANRHFTNSKYEGARWRGRSKLVRPKTRSVVRAADAVAASALFATADAVQVKAENDGDPMQLASAKAKHELLNYRLDRQSGRAGIPWFLCAIGARQDATITGVCISKQYWEYKTRPIKTTMPQLDEWGEEVLDENNAVIMETVDDVKVSRDRPMIRVFPVDEVVRDPSADWLDQAQESAYILLKHPMRRDEIQSWQDGAVEQGAVKFRDVDVDTLHTSSASETDEAGVRASREGNTGEDRYDANNSKSNKFDTIWVYECFIKIDNQDMHYWYCDNQLLSDPIPVEDAYPHMDGERPVVIGLGSLEAHKTDPLSAVSAIEPLQREATDITNLRLDNVKQNMSPITKVVRGRQIQMSQVQNRSPDSVIQVTEPDDVSWDRPPDVTASAYAEMDRINADIDELAGSFSGSSVNTNRNLNETVGGMQMLQAGANSIAEFDLRVWTETWVEPVLRQLIGLEEYYETDEKVMAIAGKKAKIEKYGVDEFTDEMLASEVTVRVNAGTGAADPMQRLEKLKIAAELVGGIVGEDIQGRVKADEFIDEIFGAIGHKDAVERFFNPEQGQDPEKEQMQQAIEQMQKELADREAEFANKIEVEKIRASTSIMEKDMDGQHAQAEMQAQAAIDAQIEPMKMFLENAFQDQKSEKAHEQGEESADNAHMRQIMQNAMQSQQGETKPQAGR